MFYLQDLRYACRQLGRSLAFTVLTVVVLAGGLSVSIFTFSFLYTAMLKPLPVAEGEQVVRVMTMGGGRTLGLIDAADLAAVRQSVASLAELGAFTDVELLLGTGEGARPISATATEWNIFAFTRTAPLMGRGFTVDDQAPGAERVVVLTHATWQNVFGGDEGVLDSLQQLNGVATRVIGIMPPGYAFPVTTEAYVPIRPELLTATTPGIAVLQAYARLAPGVDRDQVTAELTGLLQRVVADRPPSSSGLQPTGMTVQSFQMAQIDGATVTLTVPNILAALILLLACVNVTNLLLTRANERARETAVRLALGASRARIIVQTTWESALLCIIGGTLGTGLAIWALTAVNGWARATLPGNLAFWWVWGYDASVLGAGAAFVTLTIVVLGTVASRRAVNTEINSVLQEGVSRAGSRSEGRVARVLVIAQVAAVSLLMFFGTLSAIVAYRFVNVDFGYDTRNLLTATVVPMADRYPDAPARARLFQSVLERLTERAEVDSAALRRTLADIENVRSEIEIGTETDGRDGVAGSRPRAHVIASLGSLTALGIELQGGRFFGAEDHEPAARTALVSRAMAELYWPGRSPLGEQVTFAGLGESEPRTIVGIVSDVVLGDPLRRQRSGVGAYVPLSQFDVLAATVMLRHRGSEQAARIAYQEAMTMLDPLLVTEVSSFEENLRLETALASGTVRLLGTCFVFALLLAASGTYGLMARQIGRRTREIGVRRALGASDGVILTMLLGHGGRQLGIGVVLAMPLLLAIGWVFSLVFPISFSLASATAFAVSAAIGLIVLTATWLPARRAIAIAPRDAIWRE